MGGGASSLEAQNQKAMDRKILEKMKEDTNKEKQVARILLLGSGECGKTTILKQFKIIMADGFTENDRKDATKQCRVNTLDSIKSLIEARETLDNPAIMPDDDTQHDAKSLETTENNQLLIASNLEDIKEKIKAVWKSDCIQKVKLRDNEFQLLDSAEYFLKDENIDRVFSESFSPTDQDILRTRLKTTGVKETEFMYAAKNSKPMTFKVFDVGGQRGERKNWINCFDDVTAILFIASLSEYDQVLAEDGERNRLDESLDLFDGIVNLSWFQQADFILFLNKKDLFEKKILEKDKDGKPTRPLRQFQPGAAEVAPLNVNEALQWIQTEYMERVEDNVKQMNKEPAVSYVFQNKTIYIHATNATDTKNIEFVWTATAQILIVKKLKESGMM